MSGALHFRPCRRRAARWLAALGLAAWAALAAPPARGAGEAERIMIDRARIIVNDRMMTAREVEGTRRVLEAQYRQTYTGEELQRRLAGIEEALTDQLVEDLLLESQAERLNIEVDEKELQERVDTVTRRDPNVLRIYTEREIKALISRQMLRQRVLQREVDAYVHVRDTDIREACEAEAGARREVNVGHILIRGDDPSALSRIREIRRKLEAGADFEEMALAHSEDPSAARNKGHLGYVSRGQFVKPFEDVAFALPEGALSEPVQTQFGWHLIRLFGSRTKAELDCDRLDDNNRKRFQAIVFSRLKEERLERYLALLRERAVIQILKR